MMVHPSSHRISRARRYFGFRSPIHSFTYRTLTFFGQPSHAVQLTLADAKCSPYPERIAPFGLAFSPFARHYSGNLGWFLFLVLLRCFSSDGSPHTAMDSLYDAWTWLHADFSIRTSADQFVLADPRSFSQLTASFFGSWCQGILPALLLA